MDPAQALADLTEISSQIEAAVLAEESGSLQRELHQLALPPPNSAS